MIVFTLESGLQRPPLFLLLNAAVITATRVHAKKIVSTSGQYAPTPTWPDAQPVFFSNSALILFNLRGDAGTKMCPRSFHVVM